MKPSSTPSLYLYIPNSLLSEPESSWHLSLDSFGWDTPYIWYVLVGIFFLFGMFWLGYSVYLVFFGWDILYIWYVLVGIPLIFGMFWLGFPLYLVCFGWDILYIWYVLVKIPKYLVFFGWDIQLSYSPTTLPKFCKI